MFLATTNKEKRLMYVSYVGEVRRDELKRALEELDALLVDLPAGFRLLTDLERLETMDPAGMTEIGKIMEKLSKKGMEMVVRVIPDPSKDIGLNILSIFHYGPRIRVVTCETMAEAAKMLAAVRGAGTCFVTDCDRDAGRTESGWRIFDLAKAVERGE